ncbi:arsenate reductase [Saccharicrinis carchari]|uniref:Arsenate reductase n=1 Tax=Saccharicrinis carchari TaxID=1168039 RepID=A0A521DXG7_SACCC|nr:hypothetical protein [Saccharicrinis carchari]SMO76366.1 arsenate reductase [Saccharicrinis carchari]
MKKILIYTERNAARSQMLQGWLNYYLKGQAKVFCAGTNIEPVHMLAQKAMMESVIDISKNTSSNISDYKQHRFDYVIVADHSSPDDLVWTHEPGEIICHPFKDPRLAEGTDQEKLLAYREICNEIEDYAMVFAMKHFDIMQ